AAVHMVGAAGHAQDLVAAVTGFGPHRAALARAMHDPVRHAAQRYDCAGLKRRSLRQTAETGSDPATVKLRKVLGFHERAARRHGQDGFAIGWMNAQGVTPRAAMPAKPDRKN